MSRLKAVCVLLSVIGLLTAVVVTAAQDEVATAASPTHSQAKPQALFMGVFHFANPQADVVKTSVIDVTSAASQEYLETLSQRIVAFKPTKVLLEYNRENDQAMNERYAVYLADGVLPGVNEVYQLGFRIARQAGLKRVYSFDEREAQWQGEALFEHLEQHEPERMAALQKKIAEITAEMEHDQTTLSLRELLIKMNQAEEDRLNKAFYLSTNDAGAGESFVGADATASWWRRNFRMYALIQQQAQAGERIVVIGGAGHMAILRDFLAIDTEIDAVDVDDYL